MFTYVSILTRNNPQCFFFLNICISYHLKIRRIHIKKSEFPTLFQPSNDLSNLGNLALQLSSRDEQMFAPI